MSKLLLSLQLLVLLAVPALGRQRVQGWCEQGNRTITVNTTTSSTATPVQRSFPSCSITVFLVNTSTKPTIYANNTGTTKTNPFVAASTGYWFFYIDDGTYDIQYSGGGISPTFSFGAVSAMDPFFYAPSTNNQRLISAKVGDTFSVKDYGATGDGSTNDLTALQAAADGACSLSYKPKLYFPRGQYNIAGTLQLGCDLYLYGDGMTSSVVFETTQSSLTRGITTDYSLTMIDIAVNTTPLTGTNFGMTAVARGFNGTPTSVGQAFNFTRFASHGWNFGMVISGKNNFDDIWDSLIVQDSHIEVFTSANSVSNSINAANGKRAWIQNNVLTGDNNGDHALYTIAVRDVVITDNSFSNEANSAVKVLTSGFGVGATCPVTTNDYHSWNISGNTFRGTLLTASLFTYCSIELPAINFTNNTIIDSNDVYTPDFGTVYIQASCQSIIDHVNSSGNTFTGLGLGAIVLLSSVQSPSDGCADPMAQGTIADFTSTNDTVSDFSTASAGTFPAINSTGSNLLRATIVNLHSNGGGGPVNLGGFATVHIYGMVTDSAPVSNVYAFNQLQSTEAGRTIRRDIMAPMQTANAYELKDSDGNIVGNITAAAHVNFDSVPGLVSSSGTRLQDAHIVIDGFTLSSGTRTVTLTGRAVFTNGGSYRCTANLSSTAVALLVSNGTGSTFTVSDGTGSSSSTGAYICIGN